MSFRGGKQFLTMALLSVVTATSIGTQSALGEADPGRKVKSKITPAYPQLAKRMNIKGTVKVEVVIGANGVVKSAKVIGGHPLLIEPAIDAVKQWRYEPATAETTMTVEFHFTE